MIDLLKLIAVTSIWVLGLTIATQKGMLLYSWREWADSKRKEKASPDYDHEDGNRWVEPIIECPYCMPSLHSIFGYLFCAYGGLLEFEWRLIILYPIVALGSSLTNWMVWHSFLLMQRAINFYDNINYYSDEKEERDN